MASRSVDKSKDVLPSQCGLVAEGKDRPQSVHDTYRHKGRILSVLRPTSHKVRRAQSFTDRSTGRPSHVSALSRDMRVRDTLEDLMVGKDRLPDSLILSSLQCYQIYAGTVA